MGMGGEETWSICGFFCNIIFTFEPCECFEERKNKV